MLTSVGRGLVSPAPVIHANGVAVRHIDADTPVPAGASLSVHPGEVVLLLGPSGSGKSTFALTLNGLIPHHLDAEVTGDVVIGDAAASASTVAELSSRVALVFQDPDAQIVTARVRDEVAFGPENLRVPLAEIATRVEAALRRLDLWERRDDDPDILSGGGRQRLAIAAALAMGTPAIVLDEPTANLDPAGAAEVFAALRDLASAGDHAIVVIEHDLDELVEVAHRVVVLDATGRTVADGSVDDVLRSRAAELDALGVWLPAVTLAALRLQRAGVPIERMPLTAAELRAAVAAAPTIDAAADAPSSSAARTPADASRTAPAANAVEVSGLTLRHGRDEVLHDVSLTIAAGEFVAIVGPNGAGKTTLAQAIAGVRRTPRGTVRVRGADVARRRTTRRIGFVFQNPEHQFVAPTVREELAHSLRGRSAAEVAERVDAMLERFDLMAHATRHPFLLSGGQKRRLSVATALIEGADVLVLDEPTYGQDRARADELLRLLGDLHAQGTTVVVVTHDMQVVAEHAERVLVVERGRVIADASPAVLFADEPLVRRARLRVPPLRVAFADLPGQPALSGVMRLADLDAVRGTTVAG